MGADRHQARRALDRLTMHHARGSIVEYFRGEMPSAMIPMELEVLLKISWVTRSSVAKPHVGRDAGRSPLMMPSARPGRAWGRSASTGLWAGLPAPPIERHGTRHPPNR